MSLLWLNGALTDKADARISPFDHGLLYGDGVWEHLRVFGGKPFRANHHLKILSAAAQAIGIDIPLSQDELLHAITSTAKVNNRTEGYVRVIVTRGPGTIGPDPRKIEPQVIITAEEYRPFPDELYGHGLHAVYSPFPLDRENPAHRHRTLNQLHVVQAKRHAIRNGCLEALYHFVDFIVGSTEGHLFAVKDGTLLDEGWQPEDATALVVRELVGDKFAMMDHGFGWEWLARDTDEVFIAGTACGIIGIVRMNGYAIGNGTEGPVTREIREAYRQLTERESK
jgi:branched-chain amino acid aminotransferase